MPGCGACCERPGDVWASVGEMLPMAWDIFERGDYDLVMERLLTRPSDVMCGMHITSGGKKRKGRCGEYVNRPVTCILFGASASRSLTGDLKLIGCRHLVESQSENILHYPAEAVVTPTELTEQVRSSISDCRLQVERPINESLQEALELIQWAHYSSELANVEKKMAATITVPANSDCPNNL